VGLIGGDAHAEELADKMNDMRRKCIEGMECIEGIECIECTKFIDGTEGIEGIAGTSAGRLSRARQVIFNEHMNLGAY
jgi:hypothetical protein